jgi:hypothetical protein
MIAGKECHLPTEICTIEGLSKEIRSNKYAMREIMMSCLKTPDAKFSEIEAFTKELFNGKPL